MKVVVEEKEEMLTGLDGYQSFCSQRDTVKSVSILKADAIIKFQGDRYEAKLSMFHYFDSCILITAVSSGYEVFRGSVDKDSIKIIDRLNKTVYRSAMYRRFGYQHPVDFYQLELLTSRFGCCGIIQSSVYIPDHPIFFDLSEDFITRRIYRDERNYAMTKFEFVHTRSNKYLTGEGTNDGGFRFYSNIMFNDFEIIASGGEHVYNQGFNIDMSVNSRKYSYIEL